MSEEKPKITRAYRSTTSMEVDRATHARVKALQEKTKIPMYRLCSLILEHGLEPFMESYKKFLDPKRKLEDDQEDTE